MSTPPRSPHPPPHPAQVPDRIVADTVHDGGDPARVRFRLRAGTESILLEPGQTWFQADHYKWVTRGLIEPPQSFAVRPDGSLLFNGESFTPDPEGARQLTTHVNQRHAPPPPPPARPPTGVDPAEPSVPHLSTSAPGMVVFKVHLDPLGHPLIEVRRGDEHVSTGLRGLAHLASEGWMRPARELHVDPLQRHVDLDGQRYTADAPGAALLEQVLNRDYRPPDASRRGDSIQVRENSAASTGFDLRFLVLRAGSRQEHETHLSQETLDLLLDPVHCGLLHPGIILRLSPPHLYVRRRRAEGGEEPIPGVPDVRYRGMTAPALQQVLNHPLLCRRAGALPADPLPVEEAPSPPLAIAPPPMPPPGPPLDPVDPVPPRTVSGPPPKARTKPPAEEGRSDPLVDRLFPETLPDRVHRGIFRELAERLHLPPQDVLLSLPRVFEDREFEILSFDGQEIGSIMELRGADFFGIYLVHFAGDRTELVYACRGTHVEWGSHRCAVQPGPGAETVEGPGGGLRGLAQDAEHRFVFLVDTPAREFMRRYEGPCAEAFARFLTPEEWAEQRETLPLIWPIASLS